MPSHHTDSPETPPLDEYAPVMEVLRTERSISQKIKAGEALSGEEISFLYQLDVPIFMRDRDDLSDPEWYVDPDDMAEYERAVLYDRYKKAAYETSVEQLRSQYGVDAEWLLLSPAELASKLPELLDEEQPSKIGDPLLLVRHLDLAARVTYMDQLTSRGVEFDIVKIFNEIQREGYHNVEAYRLFTQANAQALIEAGIPAAKVLPRVDSEHIAASVQPLQRLEANKALFQEHLRRLTREEVEAQFDDLRGHGFTLSELGRKVSAPFRLERFEDFFAEDPESTVEVYRYQNESADVITQAIIKVHEKAFPIDELLRALIKKMSYLSVREHLQQLADSGVTAEQLHGACLDFPEHRLMSLSWFAEQGIPHDKLKAGFSSEDIILARDYFRAAGMTVNVAQYAQDVSPEFIVLYWHNLSSSGDTAGMVLADVVGRVQNGSLSGDEVQSFLRAGLEPAAFFEKVSPDAISHGMYDLFVQRGVDRDVLWSKLGAARKEEVATVEVARAHNGEILVPEEALDVVHPMVIARNAKALCMKPERVEYVFSRLSEEHTRVLASELVAEGVITDFIVTQLSPDDIAHRHLERLLEAGVAPAVILQRAADVFYGTEKWQSLIDAGLTYDELLEGLPPILLCHSFDELISMGVDKKSLVERCMVRPALQFLSGNLDMLLEMGVPADQLAARMSPSAAVANADTLLRNGADERIILVRYIEANPGRTSAEYTTEIERIVRRSIA